MSAYGLDRWIDGRNRDSRQLRRVLLVIVVIASLATGVLACTAWWRLDRLLADGLVTVVPGPLAVIFR